MFGRGRPTQLIVNAQVLGISERRRALNKNTTVVIADGEPVYQEGLRTAIDRHNGLKVVGSVGNGSQALQEIRRHRPDVLILDPNLQGLDGHSVMRSITEESLPTKICVVSAAIEQTAVYDAIACGASGYLPKQVDADAICDAIVSIAAGHTVWPPEIQETLADEIRGRGNNTDPRLLSPRELEILKLVADGVPTSDIAKALYLSVATVKTHLHRSFTKLGVNDRAAAVAEALRRGLFD